MSNLSRPVVEQVATPAAPARRSLNWGKLALGCLGTFVALWLLGGGGIWLYYHWQHRQALADVQAELDRIHAAGEPITPEDMFAFHQVPPGVNDTTKLWQRAFELVEKTEDEDAKLLPLLGEEEVAYERLRADHPESVAPIAERYFKNHDDAIQAILEAARTEGEARFPLDFSEGHLADLSHIEGVRNASRLLALRSRYALARQDAASAQESVDAMLALAATIEDEPGLIQQLVRMSVLSSHHYEWRAILSEQQLSDDELAQAQQTLKEIDLRNGMRLAMLGERAMGFHAFHHMYVLESVSQEYAQKHDGVLARPADCHGFLSLMREIIEAAEEPLIEGRLRADHLIESFEQSVSSKNSPKSQQLLVTAELVPALKYAFAAYANAEAARDSAIAGIAFRRHQLKYGKPPESLGALVPEFLDAVPLDPFEPETPLKLVIEGDQYAIYSVGKDLTDDRALLKTRTNTMTSASSPAWRCLDCQSSRILLQAGRTRRLCHDAACNQSH